MIRVKQRSWKASQGAADFKLFSVAPEWRTLSQWDMAPENLREYFLEIEVGLSVGHQVFAA